MNGPWRCSACGHPAIVHPLPTCGWHPEVDYQALSADRDRWKAGADRLAAAAKAYINAALDPDFLILRYLNAEETLSGVVAAHDALTAETEGT